MPDIITVDNDKLDFTLIVWTKDVSVKQEKLKAALTKRSQSAVLPAQDFSLHQEEGGEQFEKPLFFENTDYEFEFIFKAPLLVENIKPEIAHHYAAFADAFHSKKRTNSLSGTINFRNHLGKATLPLRYHTADGLQEVSVSFTVWPTKMDLRSDFKAIFADFLPEYDEWRYALVAPTEHGFKRQHSQQKDFPLLWLAHFKSLWHELQKQARLIINAPHNRLLSYEKQFRAERIKGKIPARLEQKISGDFAAGEYARRYTVKKKKLSVDTPENRFIKFAISTMVNRLSQLETMTRKTKSTRENADYGLSEHFFSDLKLWKDTLIKLHRASLFAELSPFNGLKKESLVLQQRTGYSGFYRAWQELKMYLDAIGDGASASVKSMDELYEVWCFLKIKKLLQECGFEVTSHESATVRQDGLEWQTKDGFGGAFKLVKRGITVRLSHEVTYGKTKGEVRTLTVNQRPDIVLEAKFDSGETLIWLFDAKYRLESKSDDTDRVPDDAINQMHRYRDSLVYKSKNGYSRPVFGAFALYPGYFEQSDPDVKNVYQTAIDEIGIGAFALLPTTEDSGHYWLKKFLKTKFGDSSRFSYATDYDSVDRFYVEEPPRIPTYGMTQFRNVSRTLLVTGAEDFRTHGYYERFHDGTANFFHMRCEATQREHIEEQIIRSLKYLVIVSRSCNDKRPRIATRRWRVKAVSKAMRKDLTVEQTGKSNFLRSSESYWLFSIEDDGELSSPISKPDGHHLLEFL
ncbi:hypothetical protein AMBLS11_00360 [Alteromonas macleodii str. 'Black Sea 11']|nr:hypothetical protein AMBLS11_00360 [Alteromonas macleodii str. 'Black Sea 11']NKW89787.1 DUF2357 domain-containing protein [Alteromonadaceae bacterium A_SAG4]NKX33090.1 DUF2357 domain-containing protein [Alteromonadaceae bacterium A_SAG3]NKX69292.1 DUF2357 domain-containing protein [Alteromonadaceae bacterium A_SAG7]